jgi:methionyl-tRNA formyltransferase
MDNSKTRIVFLGTPEFAVASLDALYQAGFNIVGVITAPDKPGGRGMQLQQSAVKKYALLKNLNLLQPDKLKNPDFLAALKALNADVQVVVAFRMLPELVWNMPLYGTINLHGSLLPQYRGAAPINWAIINGETETGVTTFKLQHEIDTGNILMQQTIPIGPTETAGELHDKMKEIGAGVIVKTIEGIMANTIIEIPQKEMETAHLKIAPKLFTETANINWACACITIYNLIRGLSPYPAAFTFLNNKKLKVFNASVEIIAHNTAIGSHLTDGKTYLKFACTNGYIHIADLQLEGKKRMPIADFLRGYKFE